MINVLEFKIPGNFISFTYILFFHIYYFLPSVSKATSAPVSPDECDFVKGCQAHVVRTY